jgi:hypothetical protein
VTHGCSIRQTSNGTMAVSKRRRHDEIGISAQDKERSLRILSRRERGLPHGVGNSS